MSNRILVFYGSYRSDRKGIRLATTPCRNCRRAARPSILSTLRQWPAMLDRMYKDIQGTAPHRWNSWRRKSSEQMPLSSWPANTTGAAAWPEELTDHFLEEWFWRPAAIISYSGGRLVAPDRTMPGIPRCRRWTARDLEHHHRGPIAETLDEHGQPRATRPTIARRFSTICRRPCLVGGSCRNQRAHRAPPIEDCHAKIPASRVPVPSARAHPGQRWRRNRRARLTATPSARNVWPARDAAAMT